MLKEGKGQTSEPAAVPEPSNTITFVLLGILGTGLVIKRSIK